MRRTYLKTSRGFTLIEVMVVLSVISLLFSIVIVFTNAVRAKGNDVATISQVRQVHNAFQAAQVSQPLPYPSGDSQEYYCLGKASSDSNVCVFWGLSLTGDDNIKAGLVSGGLTDSPKSVPIVIDNLLYSGYVYKWNTATNGSAVYWAQSGNTSCMTGVEILSGVDGRVCGEDAGGGSISNVELVTPSQSTRYHGGYARP